MLNGNASQGLKNTVVMLVLFQVLRFVSLKIQNLELVPADRSGFNDLDERKISMVDYILFFIYPGMTAFLAMH
jgi:hypothetical protein|tara:strand:+ start:440 stop:658 length:219 start_codon:yes stop_codon:yes gene_type:complete